MRTKGNALVKFVASVAVCGFLLGGSAAFAADKDPADPGPEKPKPMAGPTASLKDFLDSLGPDGMVGNGYCESSCCWASGCGSVSCSDTSCTATCGSSTATYTC